jgi:transposase
MGSEATDMRCGFDRLAERVKTVIGENPQSGHLFVFRSRRGERAADKSRREKKEKKKEKNCTIHRDMCN